MINRKAAIVGGTGGQWVATVGLIGLRLRVKCSAGVRILVEQLHESDFGLVPSQQILTGAGEHQIGEAPWTRSTVLEGCDVLGFYESERAA